MQQKKEIKVIPPDLKYDKNIRVEKKILNVAAYCRVSTRQEHQENSFEAQVNYFTEKIVANPLWNYAGIYSDQGKTATSTKKRDSFNDMLEDCYAGKIDLILTKSISRFARNTVDFLRIIRELKERHIRIIFEKENIDTMGSSGELLITILSSQAQEESRNLSENVHWGIARKFEQGNVRVNHNKFLGYTKDSSGRLVIVPEEAEIVKKIFDLYLSGFGHNKIARILEQEGIKTVTGNSKWQSSVISKMLSNEKYIGDAMLQKTYTIDFITKKKIKNDGYVKRYYIENNHEPIVTRKQYYMVQDELERRKTKLSSGTRFSSRHPLSGLLVCGECGSKYTRVTQCEKKSEVYFPAWRCGERLKTGIRKCKLSPTLKEDILYQQVMDRMQIIMDAKINHSTAPLLQTRALIVNVIGKQKFNTSAMTKAMWDSIIERIVIEGKEKAVIHFKTGMAQEMTLC